LDKVAAATWRSRKARLCALVLGLAALLGATAYLTWRHWANERHRIGPNDQRPPEAVLDPEGAARPGVAELCKLGGRIEIDATRSGKPITKVYLTSTSATDSTLALLGSWRELSVLDLSGAKISDRGLPHIENLTGLETLYLSFTGIRGEGLESLGKLGRLQVLDLSKTQVADGALAHLQGLKSLQTLSLVDDPITDDGLKHLAALANMRRLDLTGTQITDAGLVHLKSLSRLEHLDLHGTSVTKAGVAELHRAIPGVTVSTSD
jgi:Leucine-rich repeat (LRR) protein